MQIALPVQVVESGADVDGGADRIRDREPSFRAALQDIEDRWPLDVFHQQVRKSVVLTFGEAADDVGVVEAPENAGLASQGSHCAPAIAVVR